ncbi:RNA polymerase subunit sigma-24 [Brevundimonas sp. LM2]|uniref:RNA polymerase sigma factor n=1 Tax=Brevundimonas sp. LM2 TaxID=1938605 RepID=UPI000983F7E3|nr:RNA polymerase sigma factor [Brevundimonas sp. LM2]AQR61897.1 RNA polymerase subunit sigma-24 [Brevundimonas sp. LM2]
MFVFTEDKARWFLHHVLPHEAGLRGWLGRKRHASIDVDDVIQETYTVLAARERVDDIRNPRAYLFTVAHSVVVRHIRKATVVSFQAIEEMEEFDPIDGAASLEQTLIDRDELRRLAEAIAAMPGQTRQAFILRRVHGHSQRETAQRMRLSESTVEKHIARGVRLLIDWYADGGKGVPQRSRRLKTENGVPYGRKNDKSER